MADVLLDHLLISLVPGVAGIAVGGAVGYAGALGIHRLFSAYPGLRRWSTLLPWRTIVVTVLLWLALPLSGRFFVGFTGLPVRRQTGLGPPAAMIKVALFTSVLTVPFIIVTLLTPAYSSPLRIRLIARLRTLAITSIAIAAVVGPYVGAGGAGRFLKPGMGGLTGSYANPRRGFAIIVLLALAVDLLLGVLQISFTPRSSLEE